MLACDQMQQLHSIAGRCVNEPLKVLNRTIQAALASVAVSGCLPLMLAASPTNRGAVVPSVGTERSAVVAQFGEPDSITDKDGKEVDIYESWAGGPKPGQKLKGVAALAAIDVVTFGFGEGTVPVLALQRAIDGGATYGVYTLTYSADNKVESISSSSKQSWIIPRDLESPP